MTIIGRRPPRSTRRGLGVRATAGVALIPVAAVAAALWPSQSVHASTRHTSDQARSHRAASHRAAGTGRATARRPWVKYYIVQPPDHGQKEFLYEIAAKTLGNGNLYTVIFDLNKGRLQPDGASLETPTAIDPGWILELPSNAHGPGVHDGPLPVVTAAAQVAQQVTNVPQPHRPAGPAVSASDDRTALVFGAALAALLIMAGLGAFALSRRWRNRAGQPRLAKRDEKAGPATSPSAPRFATVPQVTAALPAVHVTAAARRPAGKVWVQPEFLPPPYPASDVLTPVSHGEPQEPAAEPTGAAAGNSANADANAADFGWPDFLIKGSAPSR
ncbi:MAG TPA: hypothetical protein VKS82_20610 [Streptosporangiaceae bacterium]|nr:hypothetical protein [Streptosporangiaceae bacterium]